MSKGLVHIYTGNGKGKTTAALGLCVRASGHGLKCAFIQFLKARETGEISACLRLSPPVLFEQYGAADFISEGNTDAAEKHRFAADAGLSRSREILESGEFDLVVLDEIITLPLFHVAEVEQIIELIRKDRGRTELVLTGRGAEERLVELADLVTEMKEIKHYYTRGIQARKGIEY